MKRRWWNGGVNNDEERNGDVNDNREQSGGINVDGDDGEWCGGENSDVERGNDDLEWNRSENSDVSEMEVKTMKWNKMEVEVMK